MQRQPPQPLSSAAPSELPIPSLPESIIWCDDPSSKESPQILTRSVGRPDPKLRIHIHDALASLIGDHTNEALANIADLVVGVQQRDVVAYRLCRRFPVQLGIGVSLCVDLCLACP